MRLFLSPDGQAGFALKGDDIVSVFNHPNSPHRGAAVAMLHLAVQQGGRRLDAFDTQLPHLYSRAGFRVVSRTPFSDEFAPPGWSRARFEAFNGGRPDVVFMVWDPGEIRLYSGRADGRLVDTYDEAVRLQQRAVDRIAGRSAGPAGAADE